MQVQVRSFFIVIGQKAAVRKDVLEDLLQDRWFIKHHDNPAQGFVCVGLVGHSLINKQYSIIRREMAGYQLPVVSDLILAVIFGLSFRFNQA